MKTNKIFTKKNFLKEKLFSIKTSFYNGKNNLKVFVFSKLKSIFVIRNFFKIPLILTASAFFIKSQHQKSLYQETDLKKMYLSVNQNKLEDLQNGELAEFTFGDEKIKILIIKKNGKLYAFNNECPYQGNPLHKGILIHNKIKCPLHGDTFDLFTGENLIGPSIDDLKKYELNFDENSNGENKYYIKVENIKGNRAKNKVYKKDTQDNSKFIIVGGGIAALSCAKTLRECGFKGEINMISEEKFLPYNRPAISKAIQIDNNKILLKDESFFRDYDINIQLNTEVASINEVTKEIKLSNGNVKNYDKLLFCTGAQPKLPLIEGKNLSNIFTLKNIDDITEIKSAALKSKKITLVGTNLFSMEVATLLKRFNRNLEITIIDENEAPFQKVLGKEIGGILKQLHEKNGIKFKMEKKVNMISEAVRDNLKTKKIFIESSKKEDNTENETLFYKKNETNNIIKKDFIYTDMVIFGTGDSPNNATLQKGVTIEDEKIKCDSSLRTSDSNIYSAGDVCSYPNIYSGQRVMFSYYVNAMMQGRIAAKNMLGQNKTYDNLPYFWSIQGDKVLHFIGYFNKYDDIVITHPDPNNQFKFEAFYFRNGRLLGFCSLDSPNSANIMYEAIKNNIIITPDAIRKYGLDIENIKSQVSNLEIYNYTLDQIKSTLDI